VDELILFSYVLSIFKNSGPRLCSTLFQPLGWTNTTSLTWNDFSKFFARLLAPASLHPSVPFQPQGWTNKTSPYLECLLKMLQKIVCATVASCNFEPILLISGNQRNYFILGLARGRKRSLTLHSFTQYSYWYIKQPDAMTRL